MYICIFSLKHLHLAVLCKTLQANQSVENISLQIFGPVQSIFKFSTMDEVLDRANKTSYGLAAGIFTNDVNKVMHMTKNLQAGSVW